MKKIILFFSLFLFLATFIKPYGNLKIQNQKEVINKLSSDDILEKLFIEYNLEFSIENKQLFLSILKERIGNVSVQDDLELYTNKIKNLTDDIALSLKQHQDDSKKSDNSILNKRSIKFLFYLGATALVVLKFDLLKKFGKLKEFIEFIKNDFFKRKSKNKEKVYIYDSELNCDNSFASNPEHYNALGAIKNFHIMMQRLCLENVISDCDLTNFQDRSLGRSPSKEDEYNSFLDINNLFEEKFGRSKIRNLRHHLENVL